MDNNNEYDPLNEILFISVPDDFSHTIGDFIVDPDVPLPVHTGGDPADWNVTELSWEMIVSGMLQVLAYRPDHEDADYYRRFVNHVRPEIVAELSQTGIIAARNEDFDKAEVMFRALTALTPERVEGPVNLAIVYQQRAESLERIGREEDAQGFFDRAYRIFRDLLQRDTLSPDVRLNAGLFFLKIRNYESAYDQLKQFTQESEDEEKIEEAARILREIESQNLLDRLFKEAFDFIKIGDEEKGIERIQAFIDRYPDAWNAWFLLGWGRRRLGRYREAVDAFRKAISLGANNADTHNELAICLLELGEYDESRRSLDRALRLEPDNTKIMSNFGVLALKRDDPEEARRFFQTVLAIEPDDPVAQQYLELLDSSP